MNTAPTVFDVRNNVVALLRAARLGANGRLPTGRELCDERGAAARAVMRARLTTRLVALSEALLRRDASASETGPARPDNDGNSDEGT